MSAETRPVRPRHYAEYFATRIIIALLQMLPLSWCERLGNKVGWLMADVFKFRYATIHDNLSHVFPEKTKDERQQLNRAMWSHLFLMVCEIAQAPRKIHCTNWRDYVDIRDKRHVTGYQLDWRPRVMVGGHLGNFEQAVYLTGVVGVPTYAIARPLDNPLLDKWIQSFRESRGQFILPTSGSATEIQRVLDAGGLISLLGDQHAGNKGCWVDFMGRPASCHKAVALFTLTQQAPMLVSYCVRKGGPLRTEVGCIGIADPHDLDPALRDVRSLTQWYNDRLEEVIRRYPEQYWWMHRRWKEKPRRGKQRKRGPKPVNANKAA